MPQLTAQQSEFLGTHLGIQPSDNASKPTPPPVTAEENERLAQLAPKALANTDLTQGDVTKLFSRDYMSALKDAEFKGEGDPKLKDLMRAVVKGVSGDQRSQTMQGLAAIVGIPPTADQLDVNYGRFLVVRKQQDAIGTQKNDDVPPLNEDKHPDFMASRGQLMFGKVLGDAFGIHEVFASLLSPTGGLVGPGNKFVGPIDAFHLSPDNPIALHGCVHDAAGYMLTFHDDGPGYNYRDSPLEILGKNSPMSGQVTGIAYWVAEAGDDYIINRVDSVVAQVEKHLKTVRDAVANVVDSMMNTFRSQSDQGLDTAQDTELDVAQAIQDAAQKAADAATEAYDATSTNSDSMPDEAKAKLDAASNFLWD